MSYRSNASMSGTLERALKNLGERILKPLRRDPVLYFAMVGLIAWKVFGYFTDVSEFGEDDSWEWSDVAALAAAAWLVFDHVVEFGSRLPYQVRRTYVLMRWICRHFFRWQMFWLEYRMSDLPECYRI